MRDGKGLKYRPEEWRALALKWEKLPEAEREYFKNEMTRPQWRRFQLTLAKEVEGKTTFEQKLTTRADVVQMIVLHDENQSISRRIRDLEAWMAYSRKPWHRKLRLGIIAGWTKFLMWLEARGIRLVTLEDTDGDSEDHVQGGAQRGETVSPGHAAPEPGGGPARDRVPGRVDGGLAEARSSGGGSPTHASTGTGAGGRANWTARPEGRAEGQEGSEEASREEEGPGQEEAGGQEGLIEVVSR